MKWLGRTRPRGAAMETGATGAERSLVWLRLAIALAALLPGAFFAGAVRLAYVDAVDAAHNRLDELTRAAEEHAARAFERNEVVMQQMLRLLGEDDDETLRRREAQLVEQFGRAFYEASYGSHLWGIYQMLGKLRPTVYVWEKRGQPGA